MIIRKVFNFVIIFLFFLNTSNAQNSEITLEEKIGQMIMIGFRGYDIHFYNQIAKDIKNKKIGGVILFDYDIQEKQYKRNIKNPKQLHKLTKKLQKFSKTPLFIAVDQEGGRVNRLKYKYGFPKTISPQKLGEKNNLEFTYNQADKISFILGLEGINLNFAPVVDVNVNPSNPVIGKLGRSFSKNPYTVYRHSKQFIKAHNNNNILTAIKHFPGHGSSKQDSHLGFVDITNTWSYNELIPYKQLIQDDLINVIMTAHVFNKKLDDKYPATLSFSVITELLRDGLKYNGVIISDDMQMKAIANNYGLEEAIVKSINAGVDILLFGNNLKYDPEIAQKIHNIIFKKIKSGEISEDRINESYERIMKLKEKFIK